MKKIVIIIVLLFSITGTAKNIASPEKEINDAIAKLHTIEKKLSGSELFHTDATIGSKNANAKLALENGVKYFFHKEYRSAIRELDYYLKTIQVPVKAHYLSATHKLGVSYDKIGDKFRAIDSYLNYISSFITATEKNYDDLLDVMRRLLSLASSPEFADRSRIGRLLASVTSLELPTEVQSGVLFAAAKTAFQTGGDDIATQLLDKTLTTTEDKKKKMQAFYFKSLMEINRGNWDLAEHYMTEATNIEPDISGDIRDVLRLAVARISSQKGKYQTALKIYSSIPDGSEAQKDAMYESIFLLIKLEKHQQARNIATLFASRFPLANETSQIKSLMAFFQLKAGNIPLAKASVESKTDDLQSTGNWLQENIKSSRSMSQNKLSEVIQMTDNRIEHPPIVSASMKIFYQISAMKTKLATIKGDYTNTILTMGRTSIEQFSPQWVHRAEQLKLIAEEIMQIGHTLIAAERYLYVNDIDPSDFKLLESSESRRVRFNSAKSKLRNNKKRWNNLGNLFSLTHDISGKYQILNQLNSDIAAMRYLQHTSKVNNNQTEILQRRIAGMYSSLSRALELIREHRIYEIYSQSPHLEDVKFLTMYAGAINDEQMLLENQRIESQELGGQLIADDALRAWDLWKKALVNLYKQYEKLNSDIKDGITGTLRSLDELDERHQKYTDDLEMYILLLEQQLGKASSLILAQYQQDLSRKLSRQRKWAADIEWIEFDDLEAKRNKNEKKYQLEKQILSDSLKDIEQGVSWE